MEQNLDKPKTNIESYFLHTIIWFPSREVEINDL